LPRHQPDPFESVYHEHGQRIYRFCLRLCGRPDDAEDLTQEVFMAVFTDLEKFRGAAEVTTWLFQVALNRWRRMNRGVLKTVPLPRHGGKSPVADPAKERLDHLALETALTQLPEPLREAFILVKAEGFQYDVVAEALGVPVGTVKYRVHDAGIRLRAILREGAAGEEAPCTRGDEAEHGNEARGREQRAGRLPTAEIRGKRVLHEV
jgi:RNA polymerase sigma-70 factor, ECF subfamily